MSNVLGWREWAGLPELGIPEIKAKVDTGAKTSSLHAYYVKPYLRDGIEWVEFGVHPIQKQKTPELVCTASVMDLRQVTDSGGHRELRYVIESTLVLGGHEKRIELTLTDRETMSFRMLLGRQALKGIWVVDPAKSYLQGKHVTQPADG